MDTKTIFGQNLKLKRLAKKLTQERLAELVDVEVRTISRIECGEQGTEFSTIDKICKILEIDAYELFLPNEEEDSKNPSSVLLVKAQETYRAGLEKEALKQGISTNVVKKVIQNPGAAARFDQNRNRNQDPLAPIRVAALASSFALLIEQLPGEDSGAIWTHLQKAHHQIVTGVALPIRVANQVISAFQSWAKTSGTSFERFIAHKMARIVPGLSVLKPAELRELCKRNSVINIEKVKGVAEDDLFVVFESGTDLYLIGVIQAKTSVRDRMKMDAAHSKLMLEAGLWSAHITIDPDNFLGKPKFRNLADGTSELGHVWHGVYKMSSLVDESVGVFDFNKLEIHLSQVVSATLNGEMKAGWRPENAPIFR